MSSSNPANYPFGVAGSLEDNITSGGPHKMYTAEWQCGGVGGLSTCTAVGSET